MNGKPVLGSDDLLFLLTFNIAYDTGIFPSERHRANLSGSYVILGCTGARPAEVVDNEKNKPKDGSGEDLWGPKPHETKLDHKAADQLLDKEETEGRGRPKALCYEDILLMVVRHPDTGKDVIAMTIKFIHHKGSDNKPKP
jgi:hypothetical protein